MLKLLFLFTVVPTLELYLLLEIADRIGGIETIYLVILTGIVGAHLAKREGLGVLRQIQEDQRAASCAPTTTRHLVAMRRKVLQPSSSASST